MKLYYHKTDGGAEYLYDTYIANDYCEQCACDSPNDGMGNCDCCGLMKHKEGVINDDTKYIVRIDGDITKDAELTVRDNQ